MAAALALAQPAPAFWPTAAGSTGGGIGRFDEDGDAEESEGEESEGLTQAQPVDEGESKGEVSEESEEEQCNIEQESEGEEPEELMQEQPIGGGKSKGEETEGEEQFGKGKCIYAGKYKV